MTSEPQYDPWYSFWLHQLSESEREIHNNRHAPTYPQLPFLRQYRPWIRGKWHQFRTLLHSSHEPLIQHYCGDAPDWYNCDGGHDSILMDYGDIRQRSIPLRTDLPDLDTFRAWFTSFLAFYAAYPLPPAPNPKRD